MRSCALRRVAVRSSFSNRMRALVKRGRIKPHRTNLNVKDYTEQTVLAVLPRKIPDLDDSLQSARLNTEHLNIHQGNLRFRVILNQFNQRELHCTVASASSYAIRAKEQS